MTIQTHRCLTRRVRSPHVRMSPSDVTHAKIPFLKTTDHPFNTLFHQLGSKVQHQARLSVIFVLAAHVDFRVAHFPSKHSGYLQGHNNCSDELTHGPERHASPDSEPVAGQAYAASDGSALISRTHRPTRNRHLAFQRSSIPRVLSALPESSPMLRIPF